MAESKPISGDELVEKGAIDSLAAKFQNLLNIAKEWRDIIAGGKQVMKELDVSLGKNKFNSSDDLKRFETETDRANKALAAQKIALNAVAKAEADAIKIKNQLIKEGEKLETQSTRLKGAYAKESATLNTLRNAYKDLAVQGRENGRVGQLFLKQITETSDRLKLIDASVGQYQRNVGDYGRNFNGLQSSINQVSRELPSLAIGMNTFFLAISNNIPTVVDEIGRLRKANEELAIQGKEQQSIFSALTGAIFSWGTALSIGVTLLTLYGKNLVNFVVNLFTATDAQKVNTKAVEENTKAVDANNKKRQEFSDRKDQATLDQLENDKKLSKSQADQLKIQTETQDKALELQDKFNKDSSVLEKKYGFKNGVNLERFNISERRKELNEEQIKLSRSFALAQRELFAASEAEITAVVNAELTKREEDRKKAGKKAYDEERKRLDELKKLLIERFFNAIQLKQDEVDKKEDERKRIVKEQDDQFARNIEENSKKMLTVKTSEEEEKKRLDAAAKKRREQNFKDEKQLADAIEKGLKQASELRQMALDKEINQRQRNIDKQSDLAARGLKNTLVFEEEAARKAELRKEEEKKKEIRRQKVLTFYRLLAAYAENGNDGQAIAKAVRDTAIAELVAGSFYEGAENIAEALGKPHLAGKDGYLVRVDGGERVMTGEQNKMTGGMSNAELARLAYNYNNERLLPGYAMNFGAGQGLAKNSSNAMLVHQLYNTNKKLDQLTRVVENKRETTVHLDNLGHVIETVVENKVRKVFKHLKAGKIG